jgi:hypothetical protein
MGSRHLRVERESGLLLGLSFASGRRQSSAWFAGSRFPEAATGREGRSSKPLLRLASRPCEAKISKDYESGVSGATRCLEGLGPKVTGPNGDLWSLYRRVL